MLLQVKNIKSILAVLLNMNKIKKRRWINVLYMHHVARINIHFVYPF